MQQAQCRGEFSCSELEYLCVTLKSEEMKGPMRHSSRLRGLSLLVVIR
jgi:hypothetical protein